MDSGKRPPLDEQKSLWEATLAAEGITTGAGEATGLSLDDVGLAGAGLNSFISMLAVIHPGDPTRVDSKDITGFNNVTGRVTVASAFKGGQVAAGVPYKIVTFRFVPAEVAAIEAKLEVAQYYDKIFYDEDTGIAGTAWPTGTPQVPSDVIADIITMCAARNIRIIQAHGALTLAATMQHYKFIGYEHEDIADVISLGGQDVDGSHISGMLVTGAQGGANFLTIVRSIINAVTNFQGQMNRCSFWGGATSTFKDGSYIDLIDCESIYGAVTITVQAPTRASIKSWRGNLTLTGQDGGVCKVRGFKGTLVIDTMTAGTLDIYANGADITINVSCDTAGTINIYGNARVTDNHGAGITVNDYTKETQLDTIEGKVDDIEAKVDAGVPRVYVEQIPDTDFALAAIDNALGSNPPAADAENSIVDIDQVANSTFALRSLWVNVTSFGTAGTKLTFQLWVLINGVVTSVDSVDVAVLGIQSLVDLFGLQEVHADGIWITVITDSGSADAACSGTFRYAEAKI